MAIGMRRFISVMSSGADPEIPAGHVDKITTKIIKSAQRQAQDVISGKLDIKNVIDADALIAARVIRRAKDGVRLIGASGFTAKKVTFKVDYATAGATAAVEAAGGKVAHQPFVDWRSGKIEAVELAGAGLVAAATDAVRLWEELGDDGCLEEFAGATSSERPPASTSEAACMGCCYAFGTCFEALRCFH